MKLENERRVKTLPAWRALFSILVLLLSFTYPFSVEAATVYTLGPWSVSKPWNPLLIGNTTILPRETMKVSAVLEEGKTYHIFLVGDWVDPAKNGTDYDILLQGPSLTDTFTEATGFPEQVSNGVGPYFIAPQSGIYTFSIQNDEGNSVEESWNSALPAVFMVVEHIETDERYTSQLKGRATSTSTLPLEGTQVYEFTTSASSFVVCIDTPEDIDMFEARVYPMADGGSVGHLINGVPTPSGDLLNGTVTGSYGGFNTTIDGYRNPSLTATCVSMGKKMEINVNNPGGSSQVSYLLVLIAEYSSSLSNVPFYIRTNNTTPNPTLKSPLGNVYAGEATSVAASVNSARPILESWISYVVNGKPIADITPLRNVDGSYEGVIPAFDLDDVVEYSINVVDELGNVGSMKSSFLVKDRTTLSCYIGDPDLTGGEGVEVNGFTSNSGLAVKLSFKCGSFADSVSIKPDATGSYKYSYTPKQAGAWTVQASAEGDASHHPSTSESISFTMTPQKAALVCSVVSPEVKIGQPLQVTGSSSPLISGLPVEIMATSGGEVITENVATGSDGSFSADLTLPEGSWEVIAQVKGNWRWASSSSGVVSASIVPLSILDKALIALMTAVTPPYVYALVLASGIAVALVVRAKSGVIAERAPEPLRKLLIRFGGQAAAKKKVDVGGKQSYKRRSEEA